MTAIMNISDIVSEKYKSSIDQMLSSCRNYLNHVIYEVSLQSGTRELIEAYLMKRPQEAFSTINRASVFKGFLGFTESDLEHLKDKSNEEIIGCFAQVCDAMNEEERLAYFRRILLAVVDSAGCAKIIAYSQRNCPAFFNELKRQMLSTLPAWQMVQPAHDFIILRNKYTGHDTLVTYQDMSLDQCCEIIENLYAYASSFSIPSCRDLQRSLGMKKDSLLQVLRIPSFSAAEIKAEFPEFDLDQIGVYLDNYDRSAERFYFLNKQDLQEYFRGLRASDRLLKNEQALGAARRSAEEQSARLASAREQLTGILEELGGKAVPSAVIAEENRIVTVPNRPRSVLPHLSGYERRNLSEDMVKELYGNAILMSDLSAWMDEKSRNYIMKLLPELARKKKPLLVDYPLRVELYRREMNEGNRFRASEQDAAKKARILMHMLHSKGFAVYLSEDLNVGMSSVRTMANIMQENPDKRFCVLCQDSTATQNIIDETDWNCLPVNVLANGQLTIRPNVRERLREFTDSDYKVEFEGVESEADEVLDVVEETVETKAEPEVQMPLPVPEVIPQPEGEPEPVNPVSVKPKKDRVEDPILSMFEKMILEPISSAAKEETPVKPPRREMAERKQSAGKTISEEYPEIDTKNCIAETNELLPLSEEVKQGDSVTGTSGKSVLLGVKLGDGGEGVVYETGEHEVAKIYYRDKLTRNRFEKLTLMIQENPKIRHLIWPQELLYNRKGEFVGYLMPKAGKEYLEFGLSVFALRKPAVRNNPKLGLSTWNRLSLVNLSIELMKVFDELHKKGILMGDINPKNILVNPTGEGNKDFLIVDCDSFQIGGYPCPVGTVNFTSPEIYKRLNTDSLQYGEFLRTMSEEDFSLAILLFNILMLGKFPFAGKGELDNGTAMRNYNFAYRIGDNAGENTPDGPYRLIWNNTTAPVKNAFASVFTGEKVLTAAQWRGLLEKYRHAIRNGDYTEELFPNRYWDTKDRQFTVDFTCVECGKETNAPKERYEREEQMKRKHLCNSCRNIMFRLRAESVRVSCSKCGKGFTSNKYQASLADRGEMKLICPECNANVERACPSCGKPVKMRKYRFDEAASQKKPIYCDDCKKVVETTCAKCASTFTLKKFVYNRNVQKGWDMICPSCQEKVEVTCSRCGSQFSVMKFRYKEINEQGRQFVCNDCRSQWRK